VGGGREGWVIPYKGRVCALVIPIVHPVSPCKEWRGLNTHYIVGGGGVIHIVVWKEGVKYTI
jgi:hypothetical protein